MRVVVAAWLLGATVIGAAAAIQQWYPGWQPKPIPPKARVQIGEQPSAPDGLPTGAAVPVAHDGAAEAVSDLATSPGGIRARWTVPVAVAPEAGSDAASPDGGGGASSGEPEPQPAADMARSGDDASAVGDRAMAAAGASDRVSSTGEGSMQGATDALVSAAAVPASIPEAIRKANALPDPYRPKSGNLSVARVDYDDTGEVVLTGSASPGSIVRVRLDGRTLGEAAVDASGQWSLRPERPVAAGQYELKAEELGRGGEASASVSLPFAKAENTADLPLPDRLVVQPGNSLWRLAERLYGDGFDYVRIFEANRTQIEDPDLIFPGQIFQIPAPQG